MCVVRNLRKCQFTDSVISSVTLLLAIVKFLSLATNSAARRTAAGGRDFAGASGDAQRALEHHDVGVLLRDGARAHLQHVRLAEAVLQGVQHCSTGDPDDGKLLGLRSVGR